MPRTPHGSPRGPQRQSLPIYPKGFIAAAGVQREQNRVFVAMPFTDSHSDELWQAIQGVCRIYGLDARRADSSVMPDPIVQDILQELESAEIIIADLTNLNANVLYELGIAHTRCDSVILVACKGQSLPFDLAAIRCTFFDFSSPSSKADFVDRLSKALSDLRTVTPTILDSQLERTRVIVSDLRNLAALLDKDLSNETIWFSGGLSAFAISDEEDFPEDEEGCRSALLEEKSALLDLARRGCPVRCIISPPALKAMPERPPHVRKRVITLLRFLESTNEPALESIEWVVSPFRQKNLYIIGRISYIEGYKQQFLRGFPVSLRQTSPEAIAANISLCKALFERLQVDTLKHYPSDEGLSRRDALRQATIACLRRLLPFLDPPEGGCTA